MTDVLGGLDARIRQGRLMGEPANRPGDGNHVEVDIDGAAALPAIASH